MNINSLQIEDLFGIFDYDINFNNGENVLIITGPNGFGKTKILNIIFHLFNRKFAYFQSLVFKRITVRLNEDISITIQKNLTEGKKGVNFSISRGKIKIESFNFSRENNKEIMDLMDMYLSRYASVRKMNEDTWLDMRRGMQLQQEDLFPYFDEMPPEVRKRFELKGFKKSSEILEKIKVHLIQEQRLFKKVPNVDRNDRFIAREDHNVMSETIKIYSNELKEYIAKFADHSFTQTQELDSSYPARLRSEKNILIEEEYTQRYNNLKEKQKKLGIFGLYEAKQEFLTYSRDDAKALSVYIKDLESKLGVFDELLDKLQLFTSILNDRRFTFKSVKVDREKGFYFETSTGKSLELSELSSGEQHEVVLLYELIFNVQENILVLIDEPEISLHVTWQKAFLDDLLRIVKIQNIQVIIATHSPAIINSRWDLVYNLEKESA